MATRAARSRDDDSCCVSEAEAAPPAAGGGPAVDDGPVTEAGRRDGGGRVSWWVRNKDCRLTGGDGIGPAVADDGNDPNASAMAAASWSIPRDAAMLSDIVVVKDRPEGVTSWW